MWLNINKRGEYKSHGRKRADEKRKIRLKEERKHQLEKRRQEKAKLAAEKKHQRETKGTEKAEGKKQTWGPKMNMNLRRKVKQLMAEETVEKDLFFTERYSLR